MLEFFVCSSNMIKWVVAVIRFFYDKNLIKSEYDSCNSDGIAMTIIGRVGRTLTLYH